MDGDSLKEPSQFLFCYGTNLFWIIWPLKTSAFEPLVEKDEAITFPVKGFDPVTFPSTEKEKTVLKRIKLKIVLNQSGQTINSLSHISMSAGYVDMFSIAYVT